MLLGLAADIPLSEIAATHFGESGRIRAKLGATFGVKFSEHLRVSFVVQKTHPISLQIPRNLSLHVVWLKCEDLISASFWGLEAPTFFPGQLHEKWTCWCPSFLVPVCDISKEKAMKESDGLMKWSVLECLSLQMEF